MIRRCGAWARPSGINPPAAHAAWHAGTGAGKFIEDGDGVFRISGPRQCRQLEGQQLEPMFIATNNSDRRRGHYLASVVALGDDGNSDCSPSFIQALERSVVVSPSGGHHGAQRALVAPHEQTLRSGAVYFEEIQLLNLCPTSSRRCRVSSAICRSLLKKSLIFVRKSTIS
jgi:hypothetical protein